MPAAQPSTEGRDDVAVDGPDESLDLGLDLRRHQGEPRGHPTPARAHEEHVTTTLDGVDPGGRALGGHGARARNAQALSEAELLGAVQVIGLDDGLTPDAVAHGEATDGVAVADHVHRCGTERLVRRLRLGLGACLALAVLRLGGDLAHGRLRGAAFALAQTRLGQEQPGKQETDADGAAAERMLHASNSA